MLRYRYGSFCQRDAILDDTQFTFHIKTCRVAVNQGLCYMNEDTEHFYLKPRCEKSTLPALSQALLNGKKLIPKEIIAIEVEQPSKVPGPVFVEFYVTGKYNSLIVK